MNKRTGALVTLLVLLALWIIEPVRTAWTVGFAAGMVDGFLRSFFEGLAGELGTPVSAVVGVALIVAGVGAWLTTRRRSAT